MTTALDDRMKDLSFYHTIEVEPGVWTKGWPVVVPIVEMVTRHLKTIPLTGKRVLDVGCRDGLFSFEAERLGAEEVIGFDNDLSPGVPEFLIDQLHSKVRIEHLNLFDLMPETFGTFDLVIFPGVLYHLRYPFWALKLIRDVISPDGVLVLETAFLVDDSPRATLFCPVGEESPYEPTSCTFFNKKGLLDTLTSMGLTVEHFESLHPDAVASSDPNDPPVIDRCVVVARRERQSGSEETRRYWEGKVKDNPIPRWDGSR